MSEFDSGNCNESCTYSKNADMSTCRQCVKEHNMPHEECCLDFCGEFEFCKDCKIGNIFDNSELLNGGKR